MDPVAAIVAIANMVTAIMNYATEREKNMTPEQREIFNKQLMDFLTFWQSVADLFKPKPK